MTYIVYSFSSLMGFLAADRQSDVLVHHGGETWPEREKGREWAAVIFTRRSRLRLSLYGGKLLRGTLVGLLSSHVHSERPTREVFRQIDLSCRG